MLDAAGVAYRAVSPNVEEGAIKARLDRPEEVAEELARAKAMAVSVGDPDDWVIGSDSVISVDGHLFDKPTSREEAARHLRTFSGEEMKLTSAVALARDGRSEWSHAETAVLSVRPLSDEFIHAYLEMEWPEVGYCVGVFRLEGRGVQLFDRIDGNYFTILGMPLIPLLRALRERGLLSS